MYGIFALLVVVAAIFLLDPLLSLFSPSSSSSSSSDAPVLAKTPRPAINEALLALEEAGDETDLVCPTADGYRVHVFSKAPLVLYVENFVSLEERKALVELANPLYEEATITHDGGNTAQRNTNVRDSSVAVIPRSEAFVRCIEARARRLQGWRDDLWLERLRVQRYVAPAGHYGYHYDWSRSGAATGGWGRVSSLMVFVDDGSLDKTQSEASQPLVGGGTAFPRLPRRSSDRRWCRFIACDEETNSLPVDENGAPWSVPDNGTGVVFRPVVGNAVYWENFRPDGTGRSYDETWHAGLRVQQGIKVGLNIWSWGRVD